MDRFRVVVRPLGDVSASLLAEVERALRVAYPRMPVEIAEPGALIRTAYDASRQQYRAARLLDTLAAVGASDAYVLGVVRADIYEPGTNFLFGLGSAKQRTAIVATARLEDDRRPERAAERAAKGAVHEVGHAIGLGHCDTERCVMRYSNDLESFDRKALSFCERHRAMADELID